MLEKHGYEDVSVQDMRLELNDNYPEYATEENMTLKKRALADLLNKLKKENSGADEDDHEDEEVVDFSDVEVEVEDDVIEQVNAVDIDSIDITNIANMELELEDDGIINSVVTDDKIDIVPIFNSENWSDYVKSKLTEEELQDGHPRCDGLRRLVNELIGPILSKKISNLKCPSLSDNTATVAITVECKVTNEDHPAYGHVIVEESVSDANERNNNHDTYISHMSAVAETRAEGRAYRKMLHLRNEVSAEEVSSGDVNFFGKSNSAETITPTQIEGIDRVCQRLDINVLEFINMGGKIENGQLVPKVYSSIDEVTKETATNILHRLNEISENKNKPDNVSSYDKGWRN